ncbi:MAG: multidrug efflux pump subunit AcrB/ABC-type multidrug transport system ATPase subunit [Cyclobacteriaceae bacterium]|jgi:multidrug efflux pump subunit AcrB/ABC-type multidrug transport system ATPase subunit
MNFIIKRKVLIAMLFIGLSMLGFFSYKQLPVELIPNAQLPMLFVQVGTSQEVDPRYMENQAIIPLEGVVGSLEGVEKISSTAGQQNGSIQISFEQGTNTKYAYLKLTEKVEQAKKDLPKEFIIQVVKVDMGQLNNRFMNLQVRGSGGVDRVRLITQNEIIDKISNIDGIANTAIFGGREKSIEILLRDDVCKSYGISPSQVRSALNQNNNRRDFAGKVIEKNRMHFVNVVSEFTDITDIHELVVKEQGKIKLKDIADIRFGVKEESSYSRVNGKEAVTIQVTRDAQSNIIDLADTVIEKIEELNQELESKDVQIVVQSNSAETMKTNIDLIIELALIGGILAIFVLWIFLKNIRLVVAVALAIPISVYTAFNFFYAYDISINTLTLLGMALAIGMLLDNSIVVLENIYRLAAKKIDPDTAVIQGTKEVWRSIFAATLTTIMVFLPFLFSTNFLIKLMGKHIGVSIISTLLVSLVVALLLIPMITHSFLKRKGNIRPVNFENISYHNRLVQVYLVVLKSCMRFPGRTILGALGLFFITLLISMGLSFMSKNEAETKELNLYVTLPGGTTLNNTDLVIREVEKNIESLEEKKDVTSQVYEEEAVLTISLVDDYREKQNLGVPGIKNNIMERVREIPRASFSWEPPAKGRRFGSGGGDFDGGNSFMSLLGMGTQKEKLIIKGQDYDKMLDLSDDLQYYVEQLSSIKNVSIKVPNKRPEMLLELDKQIMAIYDIPVSTVLSELNSFQKEFSSGVKFKHGTDEYDIIIKTLGETTKETRDAKDLRQLRVKGNQGAEFELQNISNLNFTDGLSSIKRTNQEKQLEVEYQFIDEVNDDKDLLTAARVEIDELVERLNLPSGIALEVVHEENPLGEFGFLFLMASILIFMILASVFESFTMPIVMMFSIPMAAIGSLLALILTGTPLMNANVFIGFIILLGIVVNNGIIMIDYSNVLKKRGYRESRALIMAGLARIRPILITAITTIIALMPLALGRGEYVTEIGVPFAITVIGGLSLSTVLTLVFIPTVYAGLQTSLKWLRSQKTWVKSIQFALWLLGTYFIFTEVDSKIWQIIDFLILLLSVPACIYFISASLRKANEELIAPDEPLHIEIRNLVKIYDWDNRFTREWKSGLKIRERLGLKLAYESLSDFVALIWQIPLIVFMVFFIFYHLQIQMWILMLSILLQILLLTFIQPILAYRDHLKKEAKRKWAQHLIYAIHKAVLWFFPLFVLNFAFQQYDMIGLVIPVGVIWYLALIIKLSSDKLYREKININRIKGRFGAIRRSFYRIVQIIPIIGKKKVPFKALKGVSLKIENGMFGLLGPNGAGKSTLMRIICGILEQSYGQITINGIDVCEKREELQGLIGYLPQEFGMYENMSAWDFLNYMAIIKKLKNNKERHERIEYVLSAVHMLDQKDDKIGSFSGGMKQRIGIAQILLHLPRILVVDEPTAGLDPRERIRFRNLLVDLSRDRIVIFSTHIIEDVASSCNRVGVVKKGELKYLGEPVHMANIANGKVWILSLTSEEFELLKANHVIIHHMKDGDQIRVRCLSDENPGYGAINTKANLEDAYLCLLNEKDASTPLSNLKVKV